MWIEPTSIGSALLPGYTRVAGKIVFDDPRRAAEILWFDLPEFISLPTSGNAWLLSLLPLAFTRGEPLEIRAPVDPRLKENARQLMAIWTRWSPRLAPVDVRCGEAALEPLADRPSGAFFTAGVDSFYSVLCAGAAAGSPAPGQGPGLQHLVYVWGFDIPLRNAPAFHRKREALERVATQLGKTLTIAATNLRETALGKLGWGAVMHGPALGAVASLLENQLSSILLSASSNAIDSSTPWGTHPLTDSLLSSNRMRVVRAAGDVSRFEKTARVAQSKVALEHLHVCWKEANDRNCGACEKCLRTMTALEVLGALRNTSCFPDSRRLMERLKSIRVREPLAIPLWMEMKDPALAHGRIDLAAAIDRVVESSRAPEPLAFLRRVERRIRAFRNDALRHE
jgi:hypothetical protein